MLSNPKIIDIGSRLELFVDDYLIDAMDGISFKLHEPYRTKKQKGAADITGDYATVIKDGSTYRFYYRDNIHTLGSEDGEVTRYAESEDGINWIKPDLDIFPDRGFDHNNIIFEENCHNVSPFLDNNPHSKEEERYKALSGSYKTGMFAYSSPDGIHWKSMSEKPVMLYNKELHGRLAFDSQNVSFWSEEEKKYILYFRHFKTPLGSLRTIGRATSFDFINWTDESESFLTPNFEGEELYTNQTHPYFRAPHIYIALPTRFVFGKIAGKTIKDDEGNIQNVGSTDIMLMSARAGSTVLPL